MASSSIRSIKSVPNSYDPSVLLQLKEVVEVMTGKRGGGTVSLGSVNGASVNDYSLVDQVAVVNGLASASGVYYANAYTDFAACIDQLNAAGTTGASIIVSTEQVLNASVDASDYHVLCIGDGKFTGASTVTLTLGDFEAQRKQVFFSGITVAGLTLARPEWWTTNTTPGTTDMAAAFTAAIASLTATGGGMLDAPGYYALSSGISLNLDGLRFNVGRLLYTGTTGAAVTVGGGTASKSYIRGTISEVELSAQDWDAATVGVRIAGIRFGNIDVRKVAKFQHNVGIGYTSSQTTYFNQISIGRSENAQVHLSYDGDEGECNGNTFIGPTCYDNNYATHGQYAASYGVYIPDGSTSFCNGNTFIGLGFNWLDGSEYHIKNDIYCGGKYNTFINPRFADGGTSDARMRFSSVSAGNVLLNAYTHEVVYDASGNNTIISSGITQQNGWTTHTSTDYDSNYQTYHAGDVWSNKDYNSANDSPRKICITPGTYWSSVDTTATTTASDATVALSDVGDIIVGVYIDIAGVTGPLEVISRDYLNGTIEVSPAPDASVSTAAVTFTAPTFANETPASLRGTIEWNPDSLADGAGVTSGNITVTGAALGDMVMVGADQTLQGITATGYVSAADTVVIRLQNETGRAINLSNGDWYVRVFKY